MKKLILILMFGSLFMGCFMFTQSKLSKSGQLSSGMTTGEVLNIMGEPVILEIDRNVDEWHYCKTGFKDRFLALFFVDNRLAAKTFYIGKVAEGDCSLFVKTWSYKVPSEIQAILDKNTPTSSE